MFTISTRKDYSDADKISDIDHFREVDTDTLSYGKKINLYNLITANEKVLILVHGYNNVLEDTLEAYRHIHQRIFDYSVGYDRVIGFLWPGGDSKLDYHVPRQRTKEIAPRFAYHLRKISNVCKTKVDIMCHSMGVRVVFEALNYVDFEDIGNVFTLAAAVDNEKIEIDEKYFEPGQKADNLFVFHSKRDNALKYAYKLGDFDSALGLTGPENPALILAHNKNTRVINCSKKIFKHGAYKYKKDVYITIKNHLENNSYYQIFDTL